MIGFQCDFDSKNLLDNSVIAKEEIQEKKFNSACKNYLKIKFENPFCVEDKKIYLKKETVVYLLNFLESENKEKFIDGQGFLKKESKKELKVIYGQHLKDAYQVWKGELIKNQTFDQFLLDIITKEKVQSQNDESWEQKIWNSELYFMGGVCHSSRQYRGEKGLELNISCYPYEMYTIHHKILKVDEQGNPLLTEEKEQQFEMIPHMPEEVHVYGDLLESTWEEWNQQRHHLKGEKRFDTFVQRKIADSLKNPEEVVIKGQIYCSFFNFVMENNVRYLSEEELESTKVIFKKGRMTQIGLEAKENQPSLLEDGIYAFVMGNAHSFPSEKEELALYVALKKKTKQGLINHSSFFRGGKVLSSGLIKIKEGKVIGIENASGHYAPDTQHMIPLFKYLKKWMRKKDFCSIHYSKWETNQSSSLVHQMLTRSLVSAIGTSPKPTSFKLPTKGIHDPFSDHRQETLTEFLNRYADEELEEILNELYFNLEYVNFNAFKLELAKIVEYLNEALKEDEPYLILVKEKGFSKWVTELVLPHLDLQPTNIVNFHSLNDVLSQNSEIKKVILFEDTAYSGEEIGQFVRENVIPAFQNERPGEDYTFYLAIPYMTKLAERYFKKVEAHSMKLQLAPYKRISSLEEIVEKNFPDDVEKLISHFFPHTIHFVHSQIYWILSKQEVLAFCKKYEFKHLNFLENWQYFNEEEIHNCQSEVEFNALVNQLLEEEPETEEVFEQIAKDFPSFLAQHLDDEIGKKLYEEYQHFFIVDQGLKTRGHCIFDHKTPDPLSIFPLFSRAFNAFFNK